MFPHLHHQYKNCCGTVLNTQVINSPTCLHRAIVIIEKIGALFSLSQLKSNHLSPPRAHTVHQATDFRLQIQNSMYSCIPNALQNIWSPSQLHSDLHFPDVRQFNLRHPSPSPPHPSLSLPLVDNQWLFGAKGDSYFTKSSLFPPSLVAIQLAPPGLSLSSPPRTKGAELVTVSASPHPETVHKLLPLAFSQVPGSLMVQLFLPPATLTYFLTRTGFESLRATVLTITASPLIFAKR